MEDESAEADQADATGDAVAEDTGEAPEEDAKSDADGAESDEGKSSE